MVNMGMPVGYLLNGNYSQETNLQLIIEGRSEVGHQFLTGVATNESQNDTITQADIEKLAKTVAYALENNMMLPQNFLGIGGLKIFRDLIYLMRGLMKADHRFYKTKGLYDFPQKRIWTQLKMKFLGTLISLPLVNKKKKLQMNQAIIKPYQKVIDRK